MTYSELRIATEWHIPNDSHQSLYYKHCAIEFIIHAAGLRALINASCRQMDMLNYGIDRLKIDR